MARKVYVVGVGMTKFEKPGARKNWDYPDMAKEAGTNALKDAGISFEEIEQAVVGFCYGETTSGQRAVYELGITGIPMYNVNNACATGSTALFMAKQLVEGGIADCVLALGFEKMKKGSLGATYTDRVMPMDKHLTAMLKLYQYEKGPPAAQIFGDAGRDHMKKFGSEPIHYAKIGYKNHKHSVNNPYAQFQTEYTIDDILESPEVHSPLTKFQCCPTSDGSGAAILASEDFVKKHKLQDKAVEIMGMAMSTDCENTFTEDVRYIAGYGMTAAAAEKVYKQTGVKPDDVDVVELHDCFSANELITYEGLGLCKEGEAHKYVEEDAFTYGGKVVVNPSGGLISKGHPLGATGLAQCAELNWQVRGEADKRQVKDAKIALQHNLGLGGAAVVTMYRKADL